MRIGILAYVLRRSYFGGIKTYLYNLIKELEKIDVSNEYFLYTPSEDIELPFYDNPRWHMRVCKGLINQFGTLWQFFNAKKQLSRDKIDVFWATENILACDLRDVRIRKILNVHDIISLSYSDTLDYKNFLLCSLFGKKSYFNADHIITGSCSAKRQIENVFGSNKPISVIHNGIDEVFKPFDKKESRLYCKDKFKINENYALCVSVLRPAKNIIGLLRAFKIFKTNYKTDLQLVIVGKKWHGYKQIQQVYRKLKFCEREVTFLGCVEKEDLVKLYVGASLFVLLSLKEGFGLPVLEAMASGTPVICSNIEVFKEIAGNSAMFVNPYDADAVSLCMQKVINDNVFRDSLVNEGMKRIEQFSWKKAAKDVLDIINM